MGQNRLSHKGGNILPEGWAETTLSDIAAVNPKNGELNSQLSGFIPMALAPTDFNGHLEFEEREWDEIKKKYTHFANGDVIFAKVTPCFENGKAAIVSDLPNGIGAGSSEFYVLRPLAKEISASYVFANIKSHKFMQTGAENMTGAVGLRRVPRKFVEGFKVNLPPKAEQKVIADKLDTLLAQVETTKARLDCIPHILKTFRQSVLAAAVSGKLTEEWRSHIKLKETARVLKQRWLLERISRFDKEQEELIALGKQKKAKKFKEPLEPDLQTGTVEEIPKSWELVSVSQFAECLDSLRIPVKKEMRQASKGLYPYFGANGQVDKVDDYIFDDEIVMVTEDETFYGRTKPIAYRYSGKCWVNNHAHVLKAPTKESNDFLCFALMYYKIIPWLSGTTGRAKLTQAALNTLPLGLPPLEEQTEIVSRVEQLFAYADKIERQVQAAQQKVSKLTQSILAKAFRGELTALWRKDNPDLISGDSSAEALLAKIKAEREALGIKGKKKAKA